MADTDISLCMIVRNEAEALPGCLEAASGLVRQIVVVDTGSDDGTPAVAESLGAEVHRFEWCDDFAAARNASLELASRPWILVLDADEIVDEGSAAGLNPILSDPGVAGAKVIIENLDARGPTQPFTIVRLFRNHPSIRFQYTVHEEVTFSLLCYAAEHKMRIVQSPLRIVHHGYLPHRVAAKGERNLLLLRRELDRYPDALYLRLKEYEELNKLDRMEESEARLEETFALARGLPPGEFAELVFAPMIVANFAHWKIESGDVEAGLEAALWGLELFPGEPWLLFADALARLRRGDFRKAILRFERCLGLTIEPRDYYVEPGIASWMSHYHLAEAHLGLGDVDRGDRHLEQSLAANPDGADAHRLRVEISLRRGDPAAAMRAVIGMLKKDEKDIWALVNGASIMIRLGMREKARGWLERALAIEPEQEEAKKMLAQLDGGSADHA